MGIVARAFALEAYGPGLPRKIPMSGDLNRAYP